MKDDRFIKAKVKSAFDAYLSGVDNIPSLRHDIMRKVKGETVMKKKLSLGLVLAFVLLCIAVAAFATAYLANYFSGYADLEKEYGEYTESWPSSAKVELVRLMYENGIELDGEKTKTLLTGTLLANDQEELAAEIIASYFSGMEFMDTFNIMQHELGDITSWTLEQKALYTALLEKYGHQKADWPSFQLPAGGDMIKQDAISLAKQVLTAKFVVSQETLDNAIPESSFVQLPDYGPEPVWYIAFHDAQLYGMFFDVHIKRNGEIIDICAPGQEAITWGEDMFLKAKFTIPSEYDATREEAIRNAQSALTEVINLPYTESEEMTAQAYFFYHERYADGHEPVWLVMFSKENQPAYKVLLGYDASYIDTAPAEKEFSHVRRYDPGLDILMDELFRERLMDFWYWTIEEKAAFSAQWLPIVEEYLAANPYYAGSGHSLYDATRYVYGIPTTNDMTQAEAADMARQAVTELGVDEQAVMERSIIYYFDITNNDRPLWKLTFGPVSKPNWEPEHARQFRVLIDAKRRQVIESCEIKDAPYTEVMY